MNSVNGLLVENIETERKPPYDFSLLCLSKLRKKTIKSSASSWQNCSRKAIFLSSLARQYAGGVMGWIMFQGGVKGGKPLPPGLNPLSQRRARGDSWANYVELILHTPTGEGNLIGELAPFPSMGVSLREGTPTDRVPEPITNRAEQSLYMFFVHSVQTGRLREGTSLSSTTTVCYSWLKVR